MHCSATPKRSRQGLCFRYCGKFIEMSSDLVDYNSQVLELLTSHTPAIAFDVTYRVLDSKVTEH